MVVRDATPAERAEARKPSPRPKMRVGCLECGKKWRTSKAYPDECPKCGGADITLAEEMGR